MAENAKELATQAGGRIARARRFLSEVRNELTRVSWPGRNEVWATTIVVILVSSLFGIYLYAVDLGVSAGVRWVMTRFGGV